MSELAGVIVPVTTAVDNDDRVDEAAFRSQLRFLIDSGVHGLFVGGTAGEGPLLTSKEWERMSRFAMEECEGKINLLGNASDTSTARAIERIHILKSIGYQHVVVVPTYYIKLKSVDEHLRLFGACKEAAGSLNMIAYNIPSCAGSTIPLEAMCEMTRRGWIRYCKDSSEDMEYVGSLISKAGPDGLRVLIGTERYAAKALRMGASGLVPTCANYEPDTFTAAYEARQDDQRLTAFQERMSALVENLLLKPRSWVAGAKYAVSKRGFGSGRPVSPTDPLNEQEKADIDTFCAATPSIL